MRKIPWVPVIAAVAVAGVGAGIGIAVSGSSEEEPVTITETVTLSEAGAAGPGGTAADLDSGSAESPGGASGSAEPTPAEEKAAVREAHLEDGADPAEIHAVDLHESREGNMWAVVCVDRPGYPNTVFGRVYKRKPDGSWQAISFFNVDNVESGPIGEDSSIPHDIYVALQKKIAACAKSGDAEF